MKKFAIHNCSSNIVEGIYEAEEASHKMFGGAWGSSEFCTHIELDEAASALDFVMPQSLEIKDVIIQVGTQRVPDGDPQPALDGNGDPIEDSEGNPVMVQDFKEIPIDETVQRAVLKE